MRHPPASRQIMLLAAVTGSLGVLIGAFGAHGLDGFLEQQSLDPETIAKRVGQFDVGARYHLIHSVVLLALVAIPLGRDSLRLKLAWLFVSGIVLFSGSLYLLVLTNQSKLGMITPIGGILWVVAWGLLGWLPGTDRAAENE
ncbi:DUF423 domain-containing protein [Novipirellula artificiosorum]|uniref:DUF423 domain-containing protein n=1 Tax=Novipirellula artificiosorum TaxID=2528016 RepID=A0A5C6D8Z1_9BACT|nr:DUF423 domain-containing protein [Novipirellula artificiosorum]TWU33320.1 hypothetical protein Poly41_50730 [Novipirellula artificiosorum]